MRSDHDFFNLLRASLWGTPFSPNPGTDFAALWRELRHHAIQNLAVDVLGQADPKNQILYIRSAAQGYQHWYTLMGAQQELCQCLSANGIPCAVLKGAAADLPYPKPQHRSMGDIDLLVKPADLDHARAVLLDNGCTLTDDRNQRHMEFIKDGIHIELHRHFAVLSTLDRANRLDGILFTGLDRVEKQHIDGYEFYMLPPPENGIVLLEHINSHLESGLGLRQIIDWMLYIHGSLDDEAWFNHFQATIAPLGLEKLALTVTRMCQLYLGLRGDITWCQVADDHLCQRLMDQILAQGNFGRKQDRRTHGAMNVLNVLDSDLNFFQLLQRHGCYNWKALRKYPWLKPFAWLYQLCRYIRKGLRGRNPLGKFFNAFRKQKENADLLTDLGVQRADRTLSHDS